MSSGNTAVKSHGTRIISEYVNITTDHVDKITNVYTIVGLQLYIQNPMGDTPIGFCFFCLNPHPRG